MQTTSAKKRWSKLSKVLLTITRLGRHKTKTIEDPVRNLSLNNLDNIERNIDRDTELSI